MECRARESLFHSRGFEDVVLDIHGSILRSGWQIEVGQVSLRSVPGAGVRGGGCGWSDPASVGGARAGGGGQRTGRRGRRWDNSLARSSSLTQIGFDECEELGTGLHAEREAPIQYDGGAPGAADREADRFRAAAQVPHPHLRAALAGLLIYFQDNTTRRRASTRELQLRIPLPDPSFPSRKNGHTISEVRNRNHPLLKNSPAKITKNRKPR